MATIGFIFARGGSKTIPNKNLKSIRKNRLIDIAINDLIICNLCEFVAISSDSEIILQAADNLNVRKLKRPGYLAEDNSSEIYSWKHAIEYFNLSIDDFVLIAPTTSPFRSINTLKEMVSKLKKSKNLDGIVTIMETSKHPMFNMVRKNQNIVELWQSNKKRLINRQEGKNCFDVTTVGFCYRVSSLQKMNHIFDGRIGSVEVSNIEGIDIDTPLDLEFARYLANDGSKFLDSLNKTYL
jgi:N-acylneuraminate cytidylyltransferase